MVGASGPTAAVVFFCGGRWMFFFGGEIVFFLGHSEIVFGEIVFFGGNQIVFFFFRRSTLVQRGHGGHDTALSELVAGSRIFVSLKGV